MRCFFLKLRKYGYRRAFVFVFLKGFQAVRVLIYRVLFSDNNATLRDVRINQPVQFVGRGEINFHGVTVGVWPSPGFVSGCSYFEARKDTASIKIGVGTVFNNGATIIADKGVVEIGCRCLIGPNFFAVDSDFHGLSIENRVNGNYECANVCIGDDVFIGSDVRVMKGVSIGRGAVIGSGSVVVRDVEAFRFMRGFLPGLLGRYDFGRFVAKLFFLICLLCEVWLFFVWFN